MTTYDNPIVAGVRKTFPGAQRTGGAHALIDPNEHEQAALKEAGYAGVEYIDSLKQTDMAQWQPEQWPTFIAVVVGGYIDGLMNQASSIRAAALKVQGQI